MQFKTRRRDGQKFPVKSKPKRKKNLWIKTELKDWLYNWHYMTKHNKPGYAQNLMDNSFVITYKNGKTKRIELDSYDGEKVPLQHIENIEQIGADFHGDYYTDDLDD